MDRPNSQEEDFFNHTLKEKALSERTPFFYYLRMAYALVVLFVFLVALEMMIGSFKLLGHDFMEDLVVATTNPFIALFIGLLATALIQSSTTTTSMIVAIVASGSLSLKNAVPMIMGANIGTTVTCILVSFAQLAHKKAFQRAFRVAGLHHFFNVLTAIIFFPLEYYFHFLSDMSEYLSRLIYAPSFPESDFNVFKYTVYPLADFLTGLLQNVPLVSLLIALAMLYLSIQAFIRLLKDFVSTWNPELSLFGHPAKSFLIGTFGTAVIHSSAVTTSLLVTLAASSKLKAKKAFPFIVGANIGTTFTALTGALAVSSPALAIALTHFLFNILGGILFLFFPFIKELPFYFSKRLSLLVTRIKYASVLYLAIIFFVLPFVLIYFSRQNTTIKEYRYLSDNKVTHEQRRWLYVEELDNETASSKISVYYFKTDKNQEEYSRSFENFRHQNVLFIDNSHFIIGEAGSCELTNSGTLPKRTCLKQILAPYRYNIQHTADTCLIYTTVFNGLYEKTYIDLKNKLLLRKEVKSPDGSILYTEMLEKENLR